MISKRFSLILSALLLTGVMGAANASHIAYSAFADSVTGGLAGLLCGDTDPTCADTIAFFQGQGLPGIPVAGAVAFDAVGGINTLWFQAGAFFFSDMFTGNCIGVPPPGDGTCVSTDPAYDGVSAFVPIDSTQTSSSVVLDGTGFPVSGAFAFVGYSPTFGINLPFMADLDAGTFTLGAGFLGGASGVGAFKPAVIPIPAAAWLFGSALIGLVGLRRRG